MGWITSMSSHLTRSIQITIYVGAMVFAFSGVAVAGPGSSGNILHAGGVLSGGQYITPSLVSSSEGAVLQLQMQTDCNLVLYLGWGTLWSSGTSGKGTGCQARMQSDGNFVVYTSQNQAVCSFRKTPSHPGATLPFKTTAMSLSTTAIKRSGLAALSFRTNRRAKVCRSAAGQILIPSGSCKSFFNQWQQTSISNSGCKGIISNVDGPSGA